MLKSRDGTRLAGKDSFKVSDRLRRLLQSISQVGRQSTGGRKTLGKERSAEVTLGVYETLPKDIGRRRTVASLRLAQRLGFVIQAQHEFDEAPQSLCVNTQTPESVGSSDSERTATTLVTLSAAVAEYP